MSPGPRVDAFISFDNQLLQGRGEAEVMTKVQGWNSLGIFEFGQLEVCLPEHAIKGWAAWPSAEEIIPASRAVRVSLPEWTPASAAVAMAHVIDHARSDDRAAANFAARITRID